MIIKSHEIPKIIKGHWSTQGLVGYWPMMPYEFGGKVVHDLSGNNLIGVFSGNTHFVPGKYGSALRFGGVDDFVTVAYSPVFETDDISVEIMFKCDSTTHDGYICSQSDNSMDYNEWGITQVGDTFNVAVQDSSAPGGQFWEWESDPYTIVANTWYHVVLVIQGANAYFYVDGQLYDSGILAAGSRNKGTMNLTIGTRTGATSWDFEGDISFVRRYNRALPAWQIAELYQNPLLPIEREPIELWVGATSVGAPTAGIAVLRRRRAG